jgi:hypothetical protein
MAASLVPSSELPPILLMPPTRGYDWNDLALLLRASPYQWIKILLRELPGRDNDAKKQLFKDAMKVRGGFHRFRTEVLGLHMFIKENEEPVQVPVKPVKL